MSHSFKQDPYRAMRKHPSPEGYPYKSQSLNSEQLIHSRSASESSTTGLATNNTAAKHMYRTEDEYNNFDYEQQDPYAPRIKKEPKKRKKKNNQPQSDINNEEEKRNNSYLPYSNHQQDPYNPIEPIHLQEEDSIDGLPSFSSPRAHNSYGPVGSILQDNINIDMMNDHPYYTPYQINNQKTKNGTTNSILIQSLPPAKKKKWWTRTLGISGRKLTFIVFGFIAAVAVVWYFVWPREPTLQFLAADLVDGTTANYTSTSIEANWLVNFTVLNSESWIPTQMQNFAVKLIEGSSGDTFGTGNSGHVVLKARSIDQIVSIPINIDFTRDATNPTLKTLLNACSVLNEDLSSPMPKQSLDIRFRVTYYISGIVWHTSGDVIPASYFQCPS
ncbi:MAG: hypothetical protein EXX96DRAFT_558092 [Benjaminiella poitrasii]|nr:MAG: hypothetical protein EXX96DRAFT_558092 [Benjaminiella poitrasii]